MNLVIYNPLYVFYWPHAGDFRVTTITDGRTSVGYYYDHGGSLQGDVLVPSFLNVFSPWHTVPNTRIRAWNFQGDFAPYEQEVYALGPSPVSDFSIHGQAVGMMINPDDPAWQKQQTFSYG